MPDGDLTGQGREQRRFSLLGTLMLGQEPVPAARGIGGPRLGWIEDDEAQLIGEPVEAGQTRNVGSVLLTAVQYQDQRTRRAVRVGRHIEVVVACFRPMRVVTMDRASARGADALAGLEVTVDDAVTISGGGLRPGAVARQMQATLDEGRGLGEAPIAPQMHGLGQDRLECLVHH
jgi:hypothetical protein